MAINDQAVRPLPCLPKGPVDAPVATLNVLEFEVRKHSISMLRSWYGNQYQSLRVSRNEWVRRRIAAMFATQASLRGITFIQGQSLIGLRRVAGNGDRARNRHRASVVADLVAYTCTGFSSVGFSLCRLPTTTQTSAADNMRKRNTSTPERSCRVRSCQVSLLRQHLHEFRTPLTLILGPAGPTPGNNHATKRRRQRPTSSIEAPGKLNRLGR